MCPTWTILIRPAGVPMRYITSDALIRCYSKGASSHMEEIINHFRRLGCVCVGTCSTISIAGSNIEICDTCTRGLIDM